MYTTVKYTGTVNVSQQIDRMTHTDIDRVQCVTPKAVLWHMPSKRPLTGRDLLDTVRPTSTDLPGIEKMLHMGFPLHRLQVGHLQEQDWCF